MSVIGYRSTTANWDNDNIADLERCGSELHAQAGKLEVLNKNGGF